jgi:hypothetical protein
MADYFSLISGLFGCLSMGLYVLQLVKGSSIPNPATWIIWLIIGVINLLTYFLVVEHNLLRSLTLLVVTSGILVVTVYSLVRGRFAKLRLLDIVCFLLALMIVVLWRVTGDPILANLILQVVYIISFIPTILGLHQGILKEKPWPWILAVGGYVFMIAATMVSWTNQSWPALAHPIINGVIGNGLVAYYAIRNKDRRAAAA